jgi:hypothetical protein
MNKDILAHPGSRIFAYFTAEFMLRAAASIAVAFDHDYESAILFLSVTTQNTQNIMHKRDLRQRYASMSTPVDPDLMTPVSRSALSRSTGLPRETVRRKIARMIERGLIVDTPRGLIVPRHVTDNPLYGDVLRPQVESLRRLFTMVRDQIDDTAEGRVEELVA